MFGAFVAPESLRVKSNLPKGDEMKCVNVILPTKFLKVTSVEPISELFGA